jgi:hypothetical protein
MTTFAVTNEQSLLPNVVLQSMKYTQWMATRGLHEKAASSEEEESEARGGSFLDKL